MKTYFSHLLRLLYHKLLVFIAGAKLGTSFRLLIIHDLDGLFTNHDDDYLESHKKCDWRYWIYINPEGIIETREVPEKYAYEMVSNWMATIKESGGSFSLIADWYETNSKYMLIHKDTDRLIRHIINCNGYPICIPPYDDSDLNELLEQATKVVDEAPYCFYCNSYHPKEQACLRKRGN